MALAAVLLRWWRYREVPAMDLRLPALLAAYWAVTALSLLVAEEQASFQSAWSNSARTWPWR